jgi:hypothetical protein
MPELPARSRSNEEWVPCSLLTLTNKLLDGRSSVGKDGTQLNNQDDFKDKKTEVIIFKIY